MLAKNLDLRAALDHMISVSELGRGQASKVVQDVEQNKEQYIVVKNNKPQAIIISIDEYMNLMEAREELDLFMIAQKRMNDGSGGATIEFNDVLEELGISLDELDKIKDKVELE